jgi:hypothetical protein
MVFIAQLEKNHNPAFAARAACAAVSTAAPAVAPVCRARISGSARSKTSVT